MNSSKLVNKFNLFNQKHVEVSRKEKALQLDVTQKYQRFKKSASLQPYYLSQARLKKITQIYRTLSTDKLRLNSESKSRRSSHAQTPEKKPMLQENPIPRVNINSFLQTTAKGKQKLTLQRQRQNQPPCKMPSHDRQDSYSQIMIKIKSFTSKFQDILRFNSDENFKSQFSKICETLRMNTEKKSVRDNKQQLIQCFKLFEDCCNRRQSIKISETKRSYHKFQEQFSNLQVQLKKKTIRCMLDQKDIQKYQSKLKQAQAQITLLKSKSETKKVDKGVNTQNPYHQANKIQAQNIFMPTQLLTLSQNTGTNINQFFRVQRQQNLNFEDLRRKVQAYAQRQKELLSVIFVLSQQGIDVQKIYADVISGKIVVSEEETEKFQISSAQLRKMENKMYAKCKKLKINDSNDADDSIISDADGLSFNYQGKSIEEDAYTARNQYKCKQQLTNQLKDKLRLNFDEFYEEIYDDDESYASVNLPTI